VSKGEQITVEVRFRGGTTRMMSLPPPQPAWAAWQTSPEVIAEVDRLLNDHTETQIAVLLNERGWRSGTGRAFTKRMISQIRCQYRLKSRYSRLREAGMLIQQEIADQLGIHTTTVHHWRRDGLLKAHAYHNKPEYLYETVGTSRPVKRQGLKRTDPRRIPKASSERMKEVQDEV